MLEPTPPLSLLHSIVCKHLLIRPFSLSHIEVNMRPSFNIGAPLLFLFLFFLVSSSILSARPLTSEQGRNIKLDKVSGEEIVLELEGGESFKLLGMENCNIGDEECLKRRMTLEAHLDYIYTQHHKP